MKTIIFKALLAILLLTMLTSDGNSQLRNQIFVGARPLGLGETFVAIADDGNAAYWNPAGLPTLKRIIFNGTYTDLYNINGLRTYYFSLMSPLKERYAIGVSWFKFGFSDEEDEEFEYSRDKIHFSFGARVYDNLYVGGNFKYLDTGAKLDGSTMGKANGRGFDFGVLYSLPLQKLGFLKGIKLGMMIHDIGGTKITYSKTDNSEIILPQNLRFGLSFYLKERISLKWISLKDALLAFDFDDRFHIGVETWLLDILGIRAGLQKDFHTDERMTYSFGVSLKYSYLQSNYAYIIPPTLPSSDVFSLSFSHITSPINITRISVNERNNIFASFYKSYARLGIIQVGMRNDYDQPLKGRMKISFPGLPASITDTDFSLGAEEFKNLEFPANFSENILDVREEDQQVEISIDYKIEDVKKSAKTNNKFRLYSRGALRWDKPAKAAAFITKDDYMVKYFVGDVISKLPYRTKDELGHFYTAATLFEGMKAIDIRYREDPETPFSKIPKDSVDYIQYPAELLKSKRGDCDDLTVLYASLLECSGIRTALVSTNDYITLMFNTGLNQDNKKFLPFGDSLFVIKNDSIWIPVEVTQVGNSFVNAWHVGGKKYRKSEHDYDFKFMPVKEVEDDYPSALPRELQGEVPDLPGDEYLTNVVDSLAWVQQKKLNLEREHYQSGLELRPTDSRLRNKLGIILVQQDSIEQAEAQFKKIFDMEPSNHEALVNLGNIHFILGEFINAEEYYFRAERYTENKAGLYLNLSILYQYLKSESPTDSIRFQSESEKYLDEAFQLPDVDETRVIDLLQISIEEIEYKDITEFQSEAKRLVAAVRKFIQDGAKSVKDVRIDSRVIKKGMDTNRRYILWWAD